MHPRTTAHGIVAFVVMLLVATTALPAGAEDDQPARQAESAPEAQPAEEPSDDDAGEDTEAVEPIGEDEWVDPAPGVGFSEHELEAVPEFDFAVLHVSDVFATGVDRLIVDDDPLPAAAERHLRVLQVEATLQRELAATRATLRRLRPEVRRVVEDIQIERAEERRLVGEIEILTEAIRAFAIQAFIDEDDMASALSGPAAEVLENRVIVDQLREGHFDEIAVRETEFTNRRERRFRLEQRRDDLDRRIDLALDYRRLRNRQLDDVQMLGRRTAAGYTQLLHDRLPTEVAGTDIPLVTLNAYVIAERVAAVERPGCGLQWWMLAGVGRIESAHGQFDGAELDVAGYPSDAIRGPALDGRILEGQEFVDQGAVAPEPTDRTETVEIAPATPDAAGGVSAAPNPGAEPAPPPVIKRLALISDTDDGRLDGDTTYDRAVGPMQFIPQTWSTYGVDANLDDVDDPQNVYDASVAAAHYLCVAAGSMASTDGQKRAYFAYNHDEEYSENVLQGALRYQQMLVIPDEPDPLAWTAELGVYDPPDLSSPRPTRNAFVDSLRDLLAENRVGVRPS